MKIFYATVVIHANDNTELTPQTAFQSLDKIIKKPEVYKQIIKHDLDNYKINSVVLLHNKAKEDKPVLAEYSYEHVQNGKTIATTVPCIYWPVAKICHVNKLEDKIEWKATTAPVSYVNNKENPLLDHWVTYNNEKIEDENLFVTAYENNAGNRVISLKEYSAYMLL